MSAGNEREFIDYLQGKATQGEKGEREMSVTLYEAKYENLHYTGSLGEKELDFLEGFRNEYGTFLIEEELLNEEIEAYKEQGKEGELPKELIQFLCQKVKESEYGDLVIAVS